MKLHYYRETDSLYGKRQSVPGVETREIADGFNPDFDAKGWVVGVDIDYASPRFDLSSIDTISLPIRRQAAVYQDF